MAVQLINIGNVANDGTGDDNYNDTRSIYGGIEKFLFNPLNSPIQLRIRKIV